MGPESIVIRIAVARHVFLDETKRHGYVVAAAAVPPGDLAPLAGDRVVSASPTEQDHRVARLHFETSGFAGPGPAASGDLPVSWPRLIRAAITVGASPVSLGTHPRPLVELCWRAALVGANLEHDASADRWRKAAAYKRLDPSEKSAVSYFLGMTQAKITSEMLLGVPYLVHLDAVLALLGQTTNQSRPDFVGFDPASREYTIALEAKGRSNGRTANVTNSAKLQSALLPKIVTTSSSACVASVASFDRVGHWQAYLEDPPKPYGEVANLLTVETLLVAYYRPLVTALLTASIDTARSDDNLDVAYLAAADLSVGLPTGFVSIIRGLPTAEPVESNRLQAVGADLVGRVMQLERGAAAEATAGSRAGADAPAVSTGLDGVQVELGPSWFLG